MRAAPHSEPMKVVESGEVEADILQESHGRLSTAWEAIRRRPTPPGRHARLRKFARVPTHVIGVVNEQRAYPRATLRLPLSLKRVAGQREPVRETLHTRNISSCGVYFLCPLRIEPGTPIELEVGLVQRPRGRGSVRMSTLAHVVRVEPADIPGWHGLAATFDDVTFHRDEHIPRRFRKP